MGADPAVVDTPDCGLITLGLNSNDQLRVIAIRKDAIFNNVINSLRKVWTWWIFSSVICMSVNLAFCIPIVLPLCLSVWNVFLPIYPPIHWSVGRCIDLSISRSVLVWCLICSYIYWVWKNVFHLLVFRLSKSIGIEACRTNGLQTEVTLSRWKGILGGQTELKQYVAFVFRYLIRRHL